MKNLGRLSSFDGGSVRSPGSLPSFRVRLSGDFGMHQPLDVRPDVQRNALIFNNLAPPQSPDRQRSFRALISHHLSP